MTPPTGSSWRCQWLANRCQALLSIGVSLACLTCQAEGRSSLLQTGADCTPAADWERAPLQESLLANLRFSCLLTGGARADEKLPWIVALHGVGSSAKEMARNLHRLEGRARVYALEGSLPFLDGGRDWFGAPPWGNPTLFSAGVADSADRVVRFIHERRARPENAGLPVLTGYSQGGILSLVLSTRHASQFRAVVSIAGLLTSDLLPEAASRAPSLPIIAFHGARDAVLQEHGRQACSGGAAEECEQSFVGFHRCPPSVDLRLRGGFARQEEIEIAALVGGQHMLHENLAVAAREEGLRRHPFRAAAFQLGRLD